MKDHEPSAAPRFLPALLLLPAAVLAWPGPGAPLVDDPYPHLAGAGLVAIATLPLALVLTLSARRLPGAAWALLAAGLVAALGLAFRTPVDTLEARRAAVLAAAACTLFVGGAQLDARQRLSLNRGLVVLALLWTATALWGARGGDGHLAGVLGNVGPLSQAALPGAVIGGWYAATRRGPWLALGVVAIGTFIAHAGAAPVLAGGISLVVALVASGLGSRWAERHHSRRHFHLLAAVAVFGIVALRGAEGLGPAPAQLTPAEPVPESPGDPAPATADASSSGSSLGGVEVRLLVWSRVSPILAQHPLAGFGPGQFQAAFPPLRDARERSLSGYDGTVTTEVEHLHSDWLEGFAELGLPGGLAWLAFLVATVAAALRAIRGDDVVAGAQGAATLALATNALFHAPLTYDPASAAIGFALFGSVHAATARAGLDGRGALLSPSMARNVGRGIAVAGIVGALLALRLVHHGRALRDWVAEAATIEEALEGTLDPNDPALARAVEGARAAALRALEAAPDSAPARLLVARQSPPDAPDARTERWRAVLAVRPWSVEALHALATDAFRRGDLERARELARRAYSLAPESRSVARSLAAVLLASNATEEADALFEVLESEGRIDAAGHHDLGDEFAFRGRPLLARSLWARADELFAEASPDVLYAWSRDETLAGTERHREALRCAAHQLWGREHVLAGEPATALRNYRQAVAACLQHVGETPATLSLELGAAEILSGEREAARQRLAGLAYPTESWDALPAWVRDTLIEAFPNDRGH